MRTELIAAIVSVASLTVGWFLNELSSYFRSRKEEKHVLNEVLFHQLNIWNLIFKTNIDFIRKGLSKHLENEGMSDDKESQMIDYIFKSFVESMLLEQFSKSIEEIDSNYTNKIAALSRHYPFIAYRISDKHVIHNYLITLEKYFEKVDKELGSNTIMQMELPEQTKASSNMDAISIMRDQLKPYFYEQACQSIEEDILLVSRKISIIKYWKIKRKMKTNFHDEFLAEYLDQIEYFLQSIHNEQ